MAGLRFFHAVDGQKTDRVDAELFELDLLTDLRLVALFRLGDCAGGFVGGAGVHVTSAGGAGLDSARFGPNVAADDDSRRERHGQGLSCSQPPEISGEGADAGAASRAVRVAARRILDSSARADSADRNDSRSSAQSD